MQDLRNLRVWQAAHQATLEVYRLTSRFPSSEVFGLTSQLRRATSSIGANIAEGSGRATDADARRCFQVAIGFACESLNHILLARDLDVLSEEDFQSIESKLQPTRQMLIRLIQRMGSRTR